MQVGNCKAQAINNLENSTPLDELRLKLFVLNKQMEIRLCMVTKGRLLKTTIASIPGIIAAASVVHGLVSLGF